jgi:hypothetical protein
VAEQLLAGEAFNPSQNDYDWLGSGIYFWQANPSRAVSFAKEVCKRRQQSWRPAVVGAVIEPGLCLDLASKAGVDAVSAAYKSFVQIAQRDGRKLPVNAGGKDLLQRYLDRAVIETLHEIRQNPSDDGSILEPIDTVFGIFVEGNPIYENSGFHEKTHVQICVRNPHCIKGVFRVSNEMLAL